MKTEFPNNNIDGIEPYFITIPTSLAGSRIDAALSEIIPELSRSVITNWLKAGAILIDGKAPKPKDRILGLEKVFISPILSEDKRAFAPEAIDLEVVYSDEHIIVINKPAGLIVHPGNGNWSGTLLNGLLHHFPELKHIPRAGIVHRLDKDTSGLMVVARTTLAQLRLVEQLQNRTVSRIYRAIVAGHPPQNGTINKNVGRDLHNRTKMAVLAVGGKEAITHFRTLQYFKEFSYIECKLETGRTHQIRVHMKSIHHPLAGDQTYGNNKVNYPAGVADAIISLNRQALHALKLSFIHPETLEVMNFTSKMPEDIRFLLHELQYEYKPDDNSLDDYDDGNWEVLYANE
ncbi:MAG: pseudouridine synthase [Burkholderiales bacterium]|jgi:23S rRNA pseudouridine1911/1915/1917 synthase|nr:pseudouridine synthase [Burkholderiales bacterium]